MSEYKIEDTTGLIKGRRAELSALNVEIDQHKQDNEISGKLQPKNSIFWDIDGKNNLTISNDKLLNFYYEAGFRKLTTSTEKEPDLVRVTEKIIAKADKTALINYTNNHLEKPQFKEIHSRFINVFTKKAKQIDGTFLLFLDSIKPVDVSDDRLNQYQFFKNGYTITTASGIEFKEYNSFNGYIWQDDIQAYDFYLSDVCGEFEAFCKNTQRDKTGNLDPIRWNSFQSGLGYYQHKYHNPALTKALIHYDEQIRKSNTDANGGTGKSITGKALQIFNRGYYLDGKRKQFSKDAFPYDGIKPTATSIFFDDVNRSFDFDFLYNQVQEKPQINQKNKREFTLNNVPKYQVSTNAMLDITSESSKRRAFFLFYGEHYSNSNTPNKEFGHNLFKDWQPDQWNLFYNFMLKCVQYYLKHGLVKFEPAGYSDRMIIELHSYEALSWLKENILPNQLLEYKAMLSSYIDATGEIKTTQKQLTAIIRQYCKLSDILIREPKKSNGEYFYNTKILDL